MTNYYKPLTRFLTAGITILFFTIILSGCADIRYMVAKANLKQAEQYIIEGVKNFDAKRYTEAENSLSEGIDYYTMSVEECKRAKDIFMRCEWNEYKYQKFMLLMYTLRGRTRGLKGDLPGAAKDLEYAVEAFPKAKKQLPEALYYLVWIELQIGNRDKASEAFERLKKLDPKAATRLVKQLNAARNQ